MDSQPGATRQLWTQMMARTSSDNAPGCVATHFERNWDGAVLTTAATSGRVAVSPVVTHARLSSQRRGP